MPEYSKMKNADLEALLKERGLPHTGKKAEMVERLQKDDEKKGDKPAVNAEDEIDWDDEGDEVAAPVAPAASKDEVVATSAEPVANVEGQSSNQPAVADQVANTDLANADDLAVQAPADGEIVDSAEPAIEEPKAPAPDYSIGLAATNLEEEIEKRKKRALKFGTKVEDDEGLKKLERAKKFGEAGPPKGLDEALPERQRKRAREGADDSAGNKRRDGGGRGGRSDRGDRGGRGGRERRDNRDGRDSRDNRDGRDNRDNRDNRRSENKPSGGSWMSEKDRAAAEARRAKFAKPAA